MVEPEMSADDVRPHDAKAIQVASLTLDDDWEAYASDRGISKATYPRFLAAMRSLEKYVGRTDLATVTKEEVGSWRQALLGSGVSENAIHKVYIPAVRSFFRWAVEAKKADRNPAMEWSGS